MIHHNNTYAPSANNPTSNDSDYLRGLRREYCVCANSVNRLSIPPSQENRASTDSLNTELMNTRMFDYKNGVCSGLASHMDMVMLTPDITVCKKPFDECTTVFINTRYQELLIFEFIDNVLPKLTRPVILVIAGEDYTFPNNTDKRMVKVMLITRLRQMQTLGEHPNITRIFVENLDAVVHNAEPIPLGINSEECRADLAYFLPYMCIDPTKPQKITNFNRARKGNNQWKERADVVALCTTHWEKCVAVSNSEMNHADYLTELGKYSFTVCVHGGGLDLNPKLWEALLVGVIPIIRRNRPYTDMYERLELPVVIVENWEKNTITTEKLADWHNMYYGYFTNSDTRERMLRILTLDYWVDYIRNY